MKKIIISAIFFIGSVTQADTVCKKGSITLKPVISNEYVNTYEVDFRDGYAEVTAPSMHKANKESAGIISVRIIRNNISDQTEIEAKNFLYFKVNGESVSCKID